MEKYNSTLINNFYKELFSSDFTDNESVLQNTKTDVISEFDTFDEWFDYLVRTYVEDTDCDETKLRSDISNCSEFINDMKTEYEDLRELCCNEED